MKNGKKCAEPALPSHVKATRQFEGGLADPRAHRGAVNQMRAEGISMQEHRKTSRGAHRVKRNP